jgi:hypothetical protein
VSESCAPSVAHTDDAVLVLCGLAAAAGAIHAVAAVEHLDESRLYAVFFVVLAVTQLGWAALAYCRPGDRWLLRAGGLLSGAVATLWLMSRTTGLPIGPEPGVAERVGPLDLLATMDELAFVLLAVLRRGGGRAWTVVAGASLGLMLASLMLVAVGGGGQAH